MTPGGHIMLDPSSAEHPRSRTSIDSSAPTRERAPSPSARNREPKKLILCFDGTGNKFHGDESDSNILKIFRMLNREADDQYHYYQPGIGTYVVSSSLSHTSMRARVKSWYQKAKDSAVGSSFDQHVVGGYRFLMRFYNPGDEIFMFGFSRGAYIARFLAEMLDHIGLLSHGNEEMVSFAWKAFSQWQCRPGGGGGSDKKAVAEEKKKHEMYNFMKGFRETFSRPVGRIRFLGVFDTVNSVPRFETAWMQRSKFPYTARSTAKVIRHAVSIDERRAKFRQDLMYQQSQKHRHHRHLHEHWENFENRLGFNQDHNDPLATAENGREGEEEKNEPEEPQQNRGRRSMSTAGTRPGNASGEKYAPYRARSKSARQDRRPSYVPEDIVENQSLVDQERGDDQDIDEVWFAGGHGDIGGGWQLEAEGKNASHVPLVWMIREAMRAGLQFDMDKVRELDCLDIFMDYNSSKTQARRDFRLPIPGPNITLNRGGKPVGPPSPDTDDDEDVDGLAFRDLMHKAHLSRIHDSLAYGGGLSFGAVTAWNAMEWMPFRRMDLQTDGSWKPISWPLPRGEVRDIPDNVRIHGSVLHRMEKDPTYRPGNLIIGGGGRGIRTVHEQYGIGSWRCVSERGDPIGEIWERQGKPPGFEAYAKWVKEFKIREANQNGKKKAQQDGIIVNGE